MSKLLRVLLLCVFSTAVAHAHRHDFTFVRLDFPGALTTVPSGINNQAVVVGAYTDQRGMVHGFVYWYGRFVTVNHPDALSTELTGINNRGDIVGTYLDNAGQHGFLLRDGRFSTIDDPAAPTRTVPQAINDRGAIVGYAIPPGTFADPMGFVLRHRTFTDFAFPGIEGTVISGVNNQGTFVGTAVSTPFVCDKLLVCETFVVPEQGNAFADDINNAGHIVGTITNTDFCERGYLKIGGDFSEFSVPGAACTSARALNDNDVIVGNYSVDTSFFQHAYIAFPRRHRGHSSGPDVGR